MEGTVIVWDISQHSSVLSTNSKCEQTFFDKARLCISRFIQRKIFSKPKDEVGLIVTGSNQTSNNLNQTIGGYENIKIIIDLAPASWEMIRILENSIKIENGSADWLDAIVVAMDYFRNILETRKCASCKIILFATFATETDGEHMEMIINGLNSLGIELVVINDHITYPGDENAPMLSPKNRQLSQVQRDSEQMIQQIVQDTSGYFCNFEYALETLMYFSPKIVRSSPWNCDLTIGTKFRIKTSVYIYTNTANVIPTFKSESTLPNTKCKTVIEFVKGDEKIEKDIENEISGHIYGSSVISIENEIKPKDLTQKCFTCIGFTKEKEIVEEYFIGTGTSLVFAQKDCDTSQKMLFALVNAMFKTKTVMLVRRIRLAGDKPKLYVLYPKYHENNWPCCSMFELGFYENRVYYDFPNLLSKKLEPSAEQLDLIDNLIDKMDLMTANEDESGKGEMLAFKKIINPGSQYIYRCFAQRALNPTQSLLPPGEELMNMIEIPAKLKQDAQPYMDRLKDEFQLEEVIKPTFKINLHTDQQADNTVVNLQNLNANFEERIIVAVGTMTPMEDFIFLLEKGEKFSTLCKQLQSVLYDLLFKSITEQYKKIKVALALYREKSIVLGAHYYNDWIVQFKEMVMSHGKLDFWGTVIVDEKLGLISAAESEATTITEEAAAEFYTIGAATLATDELAIDDLDFDDLFDDM